MLTLNSGQAADVDSFCADSLPVAIEPASMATIFTFQNGDKVKIASPDDDQRPRLWEGPVYYKECTFKTADIDFFYRDRISKDLIFFTFDGGDKFTEVASEANCKIVRRARDSGDKNEGRIEQCWKLKSSIVPFVKKKF
jgi:hypothetical protein